LKLIFIIALILNILLAQPDSRFEAFDWTVYRQPGSINSISEGYDYAYFATENAGILRFQLYQNRFEEPITTAQGLTDNQILAVHFDQNTGMLWAASENFIDYSYNAEGNWFHIDLDDTGLHDEALIQQIGSSNNYIWINAGSTFLKLDKVSGIVMGLLPLQDEDDVIWSSKRERILEIPNTLKNYVVIDGWIMNNNQFIDPFGEIVEPTTFYFGKNSDVYIGMEDGTIFISDVQMETFYPFSFGLNNSDVAAFTKSDDLWITGHNSFNTRGITRYNIRQNYFRHIDFENSINFRSQPFYSILETEKEVWFGGNSAISIYNKKKDFWREITEANGIPNGRITSMAEDSSAILVGTTRGLVKVSMINKRTEQINLERLLRMRKINDLKIVGDNLWIATDNYLLIYDQKNNLLIDFKSFGNTKDIEERKNIFTKFTDIFQNGDEIYISTPVGILKYNIKDEDWNVVVEPSAYEGSKVNNLAIENGYCFIGIDYGIWQINIDNGYSQLYDYPFIGSVQDMYIQGDTLLIGSDIGLIRYLWKKYL
jgi:ligand-binding sensor domain-containing protein